VFHVEAHVEAGSLVRPGKPLVSAADVELLRFVKYNPKFPLTLSFHADLAEETGGWHRISAETRSDLVGHGGRVLEADRVHSKGSYWFADERPEAPAPAVSIPDLLAGAEPMDLEAFYAKTSQHLRFGPSFRAVRSVWSTGHSSTVCEIDVPHGRDLFGFGTSPRFHAMPMVIDNAWRGPLMWIYLESGRFCVPVSIAAMRFYRAPLTGERVYAFSRVTTDLAEDIPIHVDTQVIDKAGHLLCDITDLVLTAVAEDPVGNGSSH
jgi:hypothetical protein